MLALALLLPMTATAASAQAKRRCSGDPPDASLLALGPVYRDCEVDRPARMRGADLPLDFVPDQRPGASGCYRAEFQFVVDTTGRPETATMRAAPSNDRGLEEAIRGNLAQVRYEPAIRQGQRVRQVVVYARTMAPLIRVDTDNDQTRPSEVRPSSNCR